MTERVARRKEKSEIFHLTWGQILFGWFSLFCLFLILRNTEIAMEYMTRGLRLCAKTVIPSLFPFMVISELIVSGGIGSALLRPVAPFFKNLFRLPEDGCAALLMGMLCGFPVGAKCAISALDNQRLTKEEVQRILLFSTNPSSAFLINAVGVSLWGNKTFGVCLYATVLLSQLLIGLIFTHFPKKKRNGTQAIPSSNGISPTKPNTVQLFTGAVGSSCRGILLICAYVIFFSALVGTLNFVLDRFGATAAVKTAVFGIFEMSGGISAASALQAPMVAAGISAFATGWSGLSVHCQLLAICDGRGLDFRPYFLAKLLHGLLCALLFGLLIQAVPSLLVPANLC